MNNTRRTPVILKNTKIIFAPNFSGIARSAYDRDGVRKFSVIVNDDAVLARLQDEGWNIKHTNPDEDGNYVYFIDLFVSYRIKPPVIKMGVGKRLVALDETTIAQLDRAQIIDVNVAFTGSRWERPNGDFGIKAYLDEALFVIAEPVFSSMYADYESDIF